MYKFCKRFLDILFSCIALIILSPILASAALLIYFTNGRPVIFRQERAGLNGSTFLMYKLRTMTSDIDESGMLLPDELRTFKLGVILRVTSIDELPELYNIIKGDMSLVGPRPLHVRYVARYDSEQIRRLSLLPGLTGWAQINGRNSINWPQKFAYDIWYVDNYSFLIDVKIIIFTVIKLFSFTKVNRNYHETMPEFMGNYDLGPPPKNY